MIKECKFCSLDFSSFTVSMKMNHTRWCDLNPKKVEYSEKSQATIAAARTFKKTHSNQWTNFDWNSVSFEELPIYKKRLRVLEEANFKCEMCFFDKRRKDDQTVIQVDHIDGNKKNNERKNLRALCPNCHAVYSEHFMFYGRKHVGDKQRFNTSSRRGVRESTQSSED